MANTNRFKINGLRLELGESEALLPMLAAKKLGISQGDILSLRILRRSLDARKKNDIFVSYNIEAEVDGACSALLLRRGWSAMPPEHEEEIIRGTEQLKGRVVVVGAGPAGLAAAYDLAKHGMRPLLIERGKAMPQREADVKKLRESGELDGESNVCFGEGGAVDFSDGKLTTRIKRAQPALRMLVENGAPQSIAYDAKPHLGTENIRAVVVNMRNRIIEMGGEVIFSAKLTGIETKDGSLSAIIYEKNGASVRVETNACVLAIGHSARDTAEYLLSAGMKLEPKAFAIGLRIEHKRDMIDKRQYGELASHPVLSAADYKLTANVGGRGVYTFCMCPGGEVICSATEQGMNAVNGMSYFARDMENSNSAVVAQIPAAGDPLGGVELQRICEAAAFNAAGGGYMAPVQSALSFVRNEKAAMPVRVKPSYLPGTALCELRTCLPTDVSNSIASALAVFERRIPGFLTEGLLTGVETRTSSPFRMVRESDGCAECLRGLYPAGEGAGYAGGIVSSAADGIMAARHILAEFSEAK